MRKEVKIAGFGGQGVILMTVLLAQAAGIFEDKEIAQTQSYGPEARGGACRAEVVISDQKIDYIKTMNPDVFIAMSQPAFDKYITEIDPATAQVFVDETLVTNLPDNIKNLYKIPATKIAEEVCGNRMVANTVMLAAVLKHADLVSIDSLKKALEQQLPAKIQAVNHKALEEGLKL